MTDVFICNDLTGITKNVMSLKYTLTDNRIVCYYRAVNVIGGEQMLYVNVNSAEDMKAAMLDRSITAKAKALLVYMVIMGEGHDITMAELQENMNEGRAATNCALRSLQEGGYLERTYTAETGKFKWNWHVTLPPSK